MMIYYLFSLIILTIVFWLFGRYRLIKTCAICAAVAITWIGGLAGIYLQAEWANPLVVAILLGASLGAIAEKYGKDLGFLWKTLWVILGFTAIYFLLQPQWLLGLGLVGVLLALTWAMSVKKTSQSKLHQDLFEDCC